LKQLLGSLMRGAIKQSMFLEIGPGMSSEISFEFLKIA